MAVPTVFFSYARADIQIVRMFADELRRSAVEVFQDVEFLKPGERFETAILEKVRIADALAFFVSPASATSRWVERELLAFARTGDRLVFPILIKGSTYQDLPPLLMAYQALQIEREEDIPAAARRLADALTGHRGEREPLSGEGEQRAAQMAHDIADDIRRPSANAPANSVFLVHGHDLGFRDEVEEYLTSLDIESVVLSRIGGGERSLLDKFESFAMQARFAVVLMSADDMGASRRQYDSPGGGAKTLKFRARENVILELGFFYGRLGWEKVFVVRKPADHVWPDFERPSDLDGVMFFNTSGESDWRRDLATNLRNAGLLL